MRLHIVHIGTVYWILGTFGKVREEKRQKTDANEKKKEEKRNSMSAPKITTTTKGTDLPREYVNLNEKKKFFERAITE